MELTAKILTVLPVKTGTSAKGEWKSVEFITETTEQYPKKTLFRIFGSEKVDNFLKNHKVGDDVVVSFDIDCREYNGRYYNDVTAWKVSKANAQQPAQNTTPAAPQQAPVQQAPVVTAEQAQQAESELPF